MIGELQAITELGRRYVALAEEHAADFATRADQHDREGSFPHENIKALVESGYMRGPAPEELGGGGVLAVHDVMVANSRLARGCASTAIAANMHISAVTEMARIWSARQRPGRADLAAAAEPLLRAICSQGLVTATPGTEAGTDLASPMTELTPHGEGFRLNGRKMFGTLSEYASLFFVPSRLAGEDGRYARHLVIVPKASPGVTVLNNWDALGMRASGSHDVTFEDVAVSAGQVLPGAPWGLLHAADLEQGANLNATLVACFLGIAEEAQRIAIEGVGRKKGARGKLMAERIPIQHLIAENELDLAAARAVVDRYGVMLDEYRAAYPIGEAPDGAAAELMRQQQLMKAVLQRNAIQIVDRAMTLSGGAGYMSKHPLARLYRDVRAGPFMQPFAPYEALEFIGKATLGVELQLDR